MENIQKFLDQYAVGERDFRGAKLSGANLNGLDLSGVQLSRADLSKADLSSTNLTGADLSGANLTSANLTKANLSHTLLNGAIFDKAILSQADMRGANLNEVNFSGTNLDEVKLNSATLSGTTMPDGSIHDQESLTQFLSVVKQDEVLREKLKVEAESRSRAEVAEEHGYNLKHEELQAGLSESSEEELVEIVNPGIAPRKHLEPS